jgi:hypothetical protein
MLSFELCEMLWVWLIEQESSLWLEFKPEFETKLVFKFVLLGFMLVSLLLILLLVILFKGFLFWVPWFDNEDVKSWIFLILSIFDEPFYIINYIYWKNE